MKNEKNIILSILVLSIFGATIGSTATAGTTFGEITSSPASPAPLSTITLSVTINGETPPEVKIWVQECNGGTGICYPDTQNVSMSLVSAGKYEVDVTLKHADATYITCQAWGKTDGAWESSPMKNITLSAGSNGTTNGNNGDGDNIIPGFEMILLMIAIGVIILIVRRKSVQ